MNTIVKLALVAWTATCLAVIHHSRLRAAAHDVLRRTIRFLCQDKALKDCTRGDKE